MRNEEYNPIIKERLEGYLKATGLSQAKAAPIIGVSMTVLSQYRNGNYKGNIKEVEKKLDEFLNTVDEQVEQKRKASPFKPAEDYVETKTSQDIQAMIQYAQVNGGIVIAHGDAGIGKTKAAQKYVVDNPHLAVYLEMSPISGTLGNMLKMLARTLKIPETRNKLDMITTIREKLEGTNKVIVIDEAQHLKLSALEQIRTLADPNSITGKKGVGIVLIGNSEIYTKMRGKQEARFAQLFSRIKMNHFFSTGNTTMEDIQKLFPALSSSTNKKELSFLLGVARSKWGVRGAVNIYDGAINNEDVSFDGLYSMAVMLGIEVI